ncbi:hypothetical protein HMPREF3034_01549 [Prevotella sp. DNF00663]|uniref:DUF262 domain-containing protein n=1 Tax=unclassified Prevotella TaxID=2638335 RepID=UPI000513A428|nr:MULTISPECIES: DUF262 domain-containing protein [unclassified Prevotella]KGI60578.1 hypothetical protein HMPREF0671_05080 [Prevotella sp. S7 MS 2]KXB82545.1 hypothetical protein HMPREF3034_01549 [Prevotella sp. DNF00663]
MATLFPVPISKPFDPSTLKIEVRNTTVSALCEMLKNDFIDLQPDFQRHADLWNKKEKSCLIESIILGIPLPSFYFYKDEKAKRWVVIDGLQRLCSLRDFMVEKKMKLEGLELLADTHEGLMFEDFSFYDQVEMVMRTVTLNIIMGDSLQEAKYTIFQRINSKGTPLQPAEIRNALFHGKSMDLVKKLAQSECFKEATLNGVSEKRLLHFDFVARFIAFYLQGYEAYQNIRQLRKGSKMANDTTMDIYIGNALETLNGVDDEKVFVELEAVFYRSLTLCHALLDNQVFSNPRRDNRREKISITLFEATMCAVANLTKAEANLMIERKDTFRRHYEELFYNERFLRALSNGTNQYVSVKTRFECLASIVIKTLNDTDK